MPKCLHISLIRPSSGSSAPHIQAISSPCFKNTRAEGAPCPAFCAPPAPDARRPIAATPAHSLTRHLARILTAGVPARRHGKVDIIFSVSVHLCMQRGPRATKITNATEERGDAGEPAPGPTCPDPHAGRIDNNRYIIIAAGNSVTPWIGRVSEHHMVSPDMCDA